VEGEKNVDALIALGADVKATDDKGQTALHHAARWGNAEVIDRLVTQGADIGHKDKEGRTPLTYAVQSKGTTQNAQKLLDLNANPHAMDNQGRRPLFYAAEAENGVTTELLIKKGAQVDAKDNKGLTPLHCCSSSRGEKAGAKELLKNGAKVDAADKQGQTPAHHAALRDNQVFVELLHQNGANLSAIDDSGATPLHCAVKANSRAAATALLKNGADPDVVDKAGKKPEQYVTGVHKEEFSQLFSTTSRKADPKAIQAALMQNADGAQPGQNPTQLSIKQKKSQGQVRST
jgi:ankyrin repeat protein